MKARDLSKALRIREKEAYSHLPSIEKSIRHQKKQIKITPYSCLSCGFVFKDRKAYKKPGKCRCARSPESRLLCFRLFRIDDILTGELVYGKASAQRRKTWLGRRLVRHVSLGNGNCYNPYGTRICHRWGDRVVSLCRGYDFRVYVCTMAVSGNPLLEADDSRLSGALFFYSLDGVDIWRTRASRFALVDVRPGSFLPFTILYYWWQVLGGEEGFVISGANEFQHGPSKVKC